MRPTMSSKLPLNLEDLLRQRTVEGDRIEYKAGWNPDPILRTLCAFANDFENLGGGYVVIGQDCDDEGQPIFPPKGVPSGQLGQDPAGTPGILQPDPAALLPDPERREVPGSESRRALGSGRAESPLFKIPKEVTARSTKNFALLTSGDTPTPSKRRANAPPGVVEPDGHRAIRRPDEPSTPTWTTCGPH